MYKGMIKNLGSTLNKIKYFIILAARYPNAHIVEIGSVQSHLHSTGIQVC